MELDYDAAVDSVMGGNEDKVAPKAESNALDYDSAVDSVMGKDVTAARAGVMTSANADADYEAHIKAVAQRNGVPIDTVREHPEEMKTQDKLGAINFDELATKNPVTTSTIGNFDKAKIVHDDITNLSGIETALQFGKNTASTLAAGAYAGTAGALGAVEAVMKNTGDLVDPLIPEGYNPLYKQAESIQALRHNQEAWRDYYKPDAETILGKGAVSGGMSFAQNVPLLAAAIFTRNPSLVLPTMTAQSFGQSYGEDVDLGISTPKATIHAGANAAIEYATEAWGINKLFGDLKAGSSIFKTMMHQVVPEIVGEQAATVLQGLNDWLVHHPEKPVKDYLATIPSAAAETLVATVVGMGGNTALLKTVEGVQKVANIDFSKAKKSESTALNIEQLNKVVAASKVLQRDPTIIHDFATEVSENGPVQNLYINAETLMQSGVAQKLSELLPSITEENIAEALATGGEIKIPVADYVTHIAGTDLAPELVDHLRVEGEDYTRAEAKDYMTNHASEMQAHVERVMAENQVTDEFKKSTEVVKENIKAQLDQVSHFDSAVNDAYATMVSSFYAVQAAQLGTTAEDLFAKYPLTVNGHNFGGQQYDQGELLSPNGHKSNLNVLQYNQVRSDNFKEFYGDWEKSGLRLGSLGQNAEGSTHAGGVSQVDTSTTRLSKTGGLVDDNGEPVIFYHGTSDNIEAFDTNHPNRKDNGWLGRGVYVTNDSRLAAGYANTKAGAESPNTMPLFVAIKNPFIATLEDKKKLKSASQKDIDRITSEMIADGFDGVMLKYNDGTVELVAFDPAKVKSAIANNGNFATTDKNILNQSAPDSDRIADEDYRVLRRQFDDLLPEEQVAFDDFINSREDGQAILARLKEHKDTSWAKAATEGIFVRQGIKEYAAGNQPNFQSMFDHKNATKSRELVKKFGYDGILMYVEGTGFVGDASKPVNKVSSTFINCNPSKDCAKYCYATEGHYRYANSVIKSELVSLAIELDPKKSAERTAAEYKSTAEFANNKALRLFDKGDGNAAWIPYIQELNKLGVRVHIFSKNPEFLRQVPEMNLRLLSIDNSNMSMADENMDLPIAFVYSASPGQTDFLAKLVERGQIQVVLPIKLGRKVSTNEQTRTLKDAIKGVGKYICPIDGGVKKIGPNSDESKWNCTKCDKNGGLGCFFGAVTDTVMNSAEVKPITSKERAARIIEIRKQIYDLTKGNSGIAGNESSTGNDRTSKALANAGQDESGRVQDLLREVDNLMGELLREYEPDTETRNALTGDGGIASQDRGVQEDQQFAGRKTIPIKPVFNQGEVGNRGSFNPSTNTITLLKDADLSTFLHETGHFFLETLFDIAARMTQEVESFGATPGQQSILKDTQALLDWFGVSDLDTWHNLDFEEKRHYHEQFARGFEQYLGEGKAPSLELHALFQRFRSWILNVYKELKNLNVKLSPEVRGVMDRLIASEEQIKLAEQGRSMMPLFESAEQAGMTEQEFAEYQQLGEDATNAAIDVLSSKATGDMQWLSNARAKSLKKMQRQHDELRRNVRSEVRTKVMSQPVYQAWSFLTRKLSKDDKINPQERPKSNPNYVDESQDSLFVAIAKLGGLVRKDIESEWGLGSAEKLKAPLFGKHVLKRNGGMAIDDMGQSLMEHGYLTPDEHGKFDQREFEEKFGNELRGQLEYSSAFASDVFAEEGKAGEHIANPWALNAGRIELSALKGMMLPAEIEQRIIDLKMTAKDGLDADVVSDIIPGFSSGDELVRAIAGAENPRDLVERMTDQTMLERHSELATPEAVQKAADEAIHNDVRARFVTREANALAQASGGTKLLASAAKEYAASIIARLKIRNIKPFQYTLAETRAAKLAEKASKAGDIKKAAAEKRNQAINLYAAKAAYDALDEVDKILRYFKKFNGDNKKVDIEYLDQIRGLLAKFDLRKQSGAQIDEKTRLRDWVQKQLDNGFIPSISESLLNPDERKAYVAQIESRNEDGDLVYADDEMRIALLADAIDRSATRSYKEATFEELQGLRDTIKQIEHIGRLKNKLLTSKDKRDFEVIRDEIADSIIANGGEGNKKIRASNDMLGSALEGIKNFGVLHIKTGTWVRIMDGFVDNGPLWRYLLKPANERASHETSMKAEATAELDAILRPIMDKVTSKDKGSSITGGKGKFIESIGDSFIWQERFAMLLNIGNESNLQRLMGGGVVGVQKTLTMRQILDVVELFSPEELNAAQAIWDHFETYRPMIAEKSRRVSGTEPKWIPIRSISIKANDGTIVTLRGGYFPVKFDPSDNLKAQSGAKAKEAKDAMDRAQSRATTNRSFEIERVEEVHGRPLLLNLQGLYSGINDVIHDLAWHEWLIDANKILKSTPIDQAIRTYYGAKVLETMQDWRDDITVGQAGFNNGVEKAAGIIRRNIGISKLGFNLVSAAIQPLGLSHSIARIGAHWVGVGINRYIADPKKAKLAAQEKSEWMTNRARTRFRELNEIRNTIQGQNALSKWRGENAFTLMVIAQATVDVPTWWGGYEKAIAEGHDEDTAIALADQGVIDSQGGGEEKDLADIERGNNLTKLFTVFYGFMNTTLNMAYSTAKTKDTTAKKAFNLMMVLMVPAVLGSIMHDALTPDSGDDDDEGLAEKLIREQLSFLAGLFVMVREVAPVITGNKRGYSGPAGLTAFSDLTGLAAQAEQLEADDALRKQLITFVGDVTGLPAVQINRTITGTTALVEGKTDNPMAIGFGFKNK
jgi:hypothetical protein